MTVATFGAPTAGLSATAAHPGWIDSPRFDLPMFVLSPLAGLAFLALTFVVPSEYAFLVQAAAFYFFAVPHYMSTYTFFLGDDNLRHYRSRRVAFFGGPAFITIAIVVLWVLRFPPVVARSTGTSSASATGGQKQATMIAAARARA